MMLLTPHPDYGVRRALPAVWAKCRILQPMHVLRCIVIGA